MTIDNRKRNAVPIKRAVIEEAKGAHRVILRINDYFLIRGSTMFDHAAWYRVQVEEA